MLQVTLKTATVGPTLTPQTDELLSGDEAAALGALDAGVVLATSYPGTPATDILEAVIRRHSGGVRCIWSVNEKVAYESALAAAIAGQRAMVAMKQVGLNVAADAFMNSCTAGVNGGLVLFVGDDPECQSSQNKQDTRYYRNLSGTLLLEPADSQEVYCATRDAFELSERFRIPVIVRLTSRTAYACSRVRREPQGAQKLTPSWPREPGRFFIVPNVSRQHFLRIFHAQKEFGRAITSSRLSARIDPGQSMLGVVCTGIGYTLAQELAPAGTGILKVAGEPFPDGELRDFVSKCTDMLVLEEGDPILESRVRLLAPPEMRVRGRLSGELKAVGELQYSEVAEILKGQRIGVATTGCDLPPRLPEICKPCGYHKVFGALKGLPDIATPSDIGCNSLGGLPPYSVMDGVWAMGSSIGVACGLAAVGHKRVLAIIGDSTFFHAGIPPLIEAIHENYSMTVLLLDNGTAAMTGGQGVAHRPTPVSKGHVDLIKLIEAVGVKRCTPFDPHELGETGIRTLVERSFDEDGVKVLLYRSQCGVYNPGYFTKSNPTKVALEKEV